MPLSNSDKLAIARTALAEDRTLLAWVRTSVGIIGFGFSFYKFFDYLAEQERYFPRHRHLGPRQYALILITCGNLALLLATLDYFRALKKIRLLDPELARSKAPLLALFMVVFGLLTMIATLLRL